MGTVVVTPTNQLQGDHSPGKPGKVREFQSGQGKVRENGKRSGEVKSGAYDAPPDPLVGWQGGHSIPIPQLLQA